MANRKIDFPPKICPVCGKSFNRTTEMTDKWRKKKACSKKCRFVLIGKNRNTSNLPKGNSHYNWKGGEYINDKGYIMVYCPNHPFGKTSKGRTYVLKHRLVMEKHLGRYLQPIEFVHHIDENKLNNSIENLELTNLSEHSRHHGKLQCNILKKSH